jgi:hypothetical protein
MFSSPTIVKNKQTLAIFTGCGPLVCFIIIAKLTLHSLMETELAPNSNYFGISTHL